MAHTRFIGFVLEVSPPFVILFGALGIISWVILHKHSLRGDIALLVEASIFSIVFCIKYAAGGSKLSAAAYYTVLAAVMHGFSLILTTIAYRLSPFHPLAEFPGPLLTKLTSLRLAYIVFTGKHYLVIDRYHRKYGKFVRIGPNTLSINSSAAITPIYKSATCFNRSDAYVLGRRPGKSLFFMLDRNEHNERKEIWAPAFTRAALESYRPAVKHWTLQLSDCIEGRQRLDALQSVNLLECLQHWAYDVMDDILFGGVSGIGLMASRDPQNLIKCGQTGMVTFEMYLGEVPWLLDILWHLPFTKDIHKLEAVARSVIHKRGSDTNGPHDDLCAHLLGEHEKHPVRLPAEDLVTESMFATQAGYDAISTTITITFVCILSHPEIHERLQKELEGAFPNIETVFNYDALASLPLLNAVIDEALRVGSPFPVLRRVVPDGGTVIDGRFVPGGTAVGIPGYSQQMSEENFFPEPHAFRPDRWLPNGLGPGSRCRRGSLMSFSFGPFGCLGRNLALQELRVVVACLLLTFDMRLAPEFSTDAFWEGFSNMKTNVFAHPLRVQVRRKSTAYEMATAG